jgi:hypothetical protein
MKRCKFVHTLAVEALTAFALASTVSLSPMWPVTYDGFIEGYLRGAIRIREH